MERRLAVLVALAGLVAAHTAAPAPAAAQSANISVGGVWICRLTQGASGLTLEQRVRQIDQRIADVLSLPLRRSQILVEVRPVSGTVAIVAAGITVITVTPADAAGTGVPIHEVANQWAARLAEGLRRALPGRAVIARMYTQPGVGLDSEAQRLEGLTWYWLISWRGDVRELVPADPRRYTIEFSPDGRVAVRADCNRATGTYVRRGQTLTIAVRAVTRAACPPGSLDRRYLAQLGQVELMNRRGDDLALRLHGGVGTMIFSLSPR
ncbi:MAG: META domain-containing protein [Armatimonadota bacterium]|nr:META domain-containing protein [Armatimonadota bacterium]MDR7456429.1 META domain-containing protein [Armatimonadota bacterium]MDR7495919.1 META domain-containing protein [Armatimonadota bacterium]